mgnify:CR=1 FL=1|tara:strand:+ start:2088 stop:2573 length:486 start_codon:yes stop_codon:yes gene_type:complete
MITKILFATVVVLVVLLTVSGSLLKNAWEDVAELEMLYKSQQAETAKAIAQIEDLKVQHAAQNVKSAAHLLERQRDNTDLKRERKTLQETASALQKALAREPVRAGRVTTYLYARGMRDVCRNSGGTAADCKIILSKSPKTRPSNPAKSSDGADPVLGTKE